jgi:hypothetical protein
MFLRSVRGDTNTEARNESDSDRLEAFSIKGETEAEVVDTDSYKGGVGIKRQAQKRQAQT